MLNFVEDVGRHSRPQCLRVRFRSLPDLSRKIEGDSVRRVLMSLYTAFIENILVLFGVIMSNIHCLSSRFFEIQPNEISSQVSEKVSKVRFLYDKPKKLKNHSNEEIGKEKKKTARGRKGGEEKKSNGRYSFYNSSFGRGAASSSTIVVGLRWPHQHFDLLSVLAHPNNA